MREQRRQIASNRRMKILEENNFLCFYCLEPATQVDHIIPYSFNQDDSESNLIACCRRCNTLVGNKVFNNLFFKTEYIREKLKKRKRRNDTVDPLIYSKDSLEIDTKDIELEFKLMELARIDSYAFNMLARDVLKKDR